VPLKAAFYRAYGSIAGDREARLPMDQAGAPKAIQDVMGPSTLSVEFAPEPVIRELRRTPINWRKQPRRDSLRALPRAGSALSPRVEAGDIPRPLHMSEPKSPESPAIRHYHREFRH
jgi:hypothetical protein